MVVNLDEQAVLHMADDRTAANLDDYFAALSPEERAGREAAAMICGRRIGWPSARTRPLPTPRWSWTVMRHVLEARDAVRYKEQRILKMGDNRRLTGTKFLWLPSQIDRFARSQQRAFAQYPQIDARVSVERSDPSALGSSLNPRAFAFLARWYG